MKLFNRRESILDNDLDIVLEQTIYIASQYINYKLANGALKLYSKNPLLYHNIYHIYMMLNDLTFYYNRFITKEIVCAIIFHDVIYDPKRNDNEDQSVLKFKELIEYYEINDIDIPKVEKIILATKDHINEYLNTNDSEIKLIINLDLIHPFMADKNNIIFNEKRIRYEYKHVPDNIYAKNRIEILTEFMEFFKKIGQNKQYKNCQRVIKYITRNMKVTKKPKKRDMNYFIYN